jgi:hypothetical protein
VKAAADSPGVECPVEVEGGADQGQVGERLREVAQGLPAGAGLLGVEAQVIRVAEHLLEEQSGVFQSGRVGAPGPGERLDQPGDNMKLSGGEAPAAGLAPSTAAPMVAAIVKTVFSGEESPAGEENANV